jgi:hypothetical protein
MAAYDYLNQVIVATALIQPYDDDSFYNPVDNSHSGYAADGTLYENGAQIASPAPIPAPFASYTASWASETPGPYRSATAAFPQAGLILLSPVALTILDQGTPTLDAAQLPLWMQFLLSDFYLLPNNFDGALNGWTPSGLAYADGLISVIYTPDAGNQTGGTPPNANSIMVLTIDFSRDAAYLDVAV